LETYHFADYNIRSNVRVHLQRQPPERQRIEKWLNDSDWTEGHEAAKRNNVIGCYFAKGTKHINNSPDYFESTGHGDSYDGHDSHHYSSSDDDPAVNDPDNEYDLPLSELSGLSKVDQREAELKCMYGPGLGLFKKKGFETVSSEQQDPKFVQILANQRCVRNVAGLGYY